MKLSTFAFPLVLPLGITALIMMSSPADANGTTAQRSVRTQPNVETIRTVPTDSTPDRPTDFQIDPQPEPPVVEATQTCDGFLACMDTLSFCDGVGGGMSQNPDGTWTCSY
ncbi:MAG: hypothetical protein AAFQ63_09205 [Cyanobacteria bacterium J06621_11]